jgi:hypothetical protein
MRGLKRNPGPETKRQRRHQGDSAECLENARDDIGLGNISLRRFDPKGKQERN